MTCRSVFNMGKEVYVVARGIGARPELNGLKAKVVRKAGDRVICDFGPMYGEISLKPEKLRKVAVTTSFATTGTGAPLNMPPPKNSASAKNLAKTPGAAPSTPVKPPPAAGASTPRTPAKDFAKPSPRRPSVDATAKNLSVPTPRASNSNIAMSPATTKRKLSERLSSDDLGQSMKRPRIECQFVRNLSLEVKDKEQKLKVELAKSMEASSDLSSLDEIFGRSRADIATLKSEIEDNKPLASEQNVVKVGKQDEHKEHKRNT